MGSILAMTLGQREHYVHGNWGTITQDFLSTYQPQFSYKGPKTLDYDICFITIFIGPITQFQFHYRCLISSLDNVIEVCL